MNDLNKKYLPESKFAVYFGIPYSTKTDAAKIKQSLYETPELEKIPTIEAGVEYWFSKTSTVEHSDFTLFIGSLELVNKGTHTTTRQDMSGDEQMVPLGEGYFRVSKSLWAIIALKTHFLILIEKGVTGSGKMFHYCLTRQGVSFKTKAVSIDYSDYKEYVKHISQAEIKVPLNVLPTVDNLVADQLDAKLTELSELSEELEMRLVFKRPSVSMLDSNIFGAIKKLLPQRGRIKAKVKWEEGFYDLSETLAEETSRLYISLPISPSDDARQDVKIKKEFSSLVVKWFHQKRTVLNNSFEAMKILEVKNELPEEPEKGSA